MMGEGNIDIQKFLDGVKGFFSFFFGNNVPPNTPLALWTVVKWVVLIIFVLGLIYIAVWFSSKIIGIVLDTWTQYIRPLYYNAEEKHRSELRWRFAGHIEHKFA